MARLQVTTRAGNCYVASEALYHLIGGKAAGWKPMRVRCTHLQDGTRASNWINHWFLQHTSGMILDPSGAQFEARGWWQRPDYAKAIGSGFLTKRPSRKARLLMQRIIWK